MLTKLAVGGSATGFFLALLSSFYRFQGSWSTAGSRTASKIAAKQLAAHYKTAGSAAANKPTGLHNNFTGQLAKTLL